MHLLYYYIIELDITANTCKWDPYGTHINSPLGSYKLWPWISHRTYVGYPYMGSVLACVSFSSNLWDIGIPFIF